MTTEPVDVLILAAGGARRFGGCKLLAQWRGVPILEHVLNKALDLPVNSVNVVLGGHAEKLQTFLQSRAWPERCQFFYYPGWTSGMGSSLAFGIGQLSSRNAVLVLLADQPAVGLSDLRSILDSGRANPGKIICAEFSGTVGVPALFPVDYKKKLQQLRGDRGAKMLLVENPLHRIALTIPSAALDIDAPDDLSVLALVDA